MIFNPLDKQMNISTQFSSNPYVTYQRNNYLTQSLQFPLQQSNLNFVQQQPLRQSISYLPRQQIIKNYIPITNQNLNQLHQAFVKNTSISNYLEADNNNQNSEAKIDEQTNTARQLKDEKSIKNYLLFQREQNEKEKTRFHSPYNRDNLMRNYKSVDLQVEKNKTTYEQNNRNSNIKDIISNDTKQILQKWNGLNKFGVTSDQNDQLYKQIRQYKNQKNVISPINLKDAPQFETISSLESSQQTYRQYNNPDKIIGDNKDFIQILNQSLENVKNTPKENKLNIQRQFSQQTEQRVGIGYDVHKLVKNRKLVIGGVELKHNKGLDGHSDADVLIHSIIDALLGACKYGDIGKLFPNTPQYKGISSLKLLEIVKKMMEKDQIKIVNIDSIIIAQAPRMAEYIAQMEQNISNTLQIECDRVSVKATTEDKLGFTGKQQGIACKAVCLIQKQFVKQNNEEKSKFYQINDNSQQKQASNSFEVVKRQIDFSQEYDENTSLFTKNSEQDKKNLINLTKVHNSSTFIQTKKGKIILLVFSLIFILFFLFLIFI